MIDTQQSAQEPVFEVVNPQGSARIVLVCEHASAHIPPVFENLGLGPEARRSHAAWDPGAMGVAVELSRALDSVLVASRISRLVYDCNRPPATPGTAPEKSEIYEIPGNIGLTPEDRWARHDAFYVPFRDAVAEALAGTQDPVLVTVHSFTPVYHGQTREVEIGILHCEDDRLAEAMLASATAHTGQIVQRNAPYGPTDGVTHTVAEHATPYGRANVMLEIRNDLIPTPDTQAKMAQMLAGWLRQAVADMPQRAL